MEVRILLLAKGLEQNYTSAIKSFGAIPTVYTGKEDCFAYDGLLLCGGSDIHPSYYHQEIDGSINIDIERDKQEFAVLNRFLDTGKPIFGICRGCQLLNVALGGTLIQDISNKEIHGAAAFDLTHPVSSIKGSIVNALYGDTFCVNSHHHQALDKLGNGLVPSLYCDEIIEAIEHTDKPYFAVQFHPERMMLSHKTQSLVDGGKLFDHFISLCK